MTEKVKDIHKAQIEGERRIKKQRVKGKREGERWL